MKNSQKKLLQCSHKVGIMPKANRDKKPRRSNNWQRFKTRPLGPAREEGHSDVPDFLQVVGFFVPARLTEVARVAGNKRLHANRYRRRSAVTTGDAWNMAPPAKQPKTRFWMWPGRAWCKLPFGGASMNNIAQELRGCCQRANTPKVRTIARQPANAQRAATTICHTAGSIPGHSLAKSDAFPWVSSMGTHGEGIHRLTPPASPPKCQQFSSQTT